MLRPEAAVASSEVATIQSSAVSDYEFKESPPILATFLVATRSSSAVRQTLT